MIKISGCFANTSASNFNSSLLYTEPEGLQGDENKNNFDFGVIAASNSAALILYLFSSLVSMITGIPPAILTNSE